MLLLIACPDMWCNTTYTSERAKTRVGNQLGCTWMQMSAFNLSNQHFLEQSFSSTWDCVLKLCSYGSTWCCKCHVLPKHAASWEAKSLWLPATIACLWIQKCQSTRGTLVLKLHKHRSHWTAERPCSQEILSCLTSASVRTRTLHLI